MTKKAKARKKMNACSDAVRLYLYYFDKASSLRAGTQEAKNLVECMANDEDLADVAHEILNIEVESPVWIKSLIRIGAKRARSNLSSKASVKSKFGEYYSGVEKFGAF